MTKPHILVLAIPGRSLFIWLRKLLSLRDRFDVTLAIPQPGFGGEESFVDRLVIARGASLDETVENLVTQLAFHRPPDGIVNLSEKGLPLHAAVCARYGLLGPSARAARIARNKWHMREFCRSLQIPIPRYAVATRGSHDLSGLRFPVVMKPSLGSRAALVKRFDRPDEVALALETLTPLALQAFREDPLLAETLAEFGDFPFVLEELIDGKMQFSNQLPYHIGEIVVDSVFVDGKTHVLGVHDSPLAMNGPYFENIIHSTPSRIPDSLQQRAKEYVERLHLALGPGAYVLHTEFRTFSDDLVLVEFGVRPGAASYYTSLVRSTGNDLVEILVDLSLRRPPKIGAEAGAPTLTHHLWASAEGHVRGIRGMSRLSRYPEYVEHQLFDDVGDWVKRPSLASRSSGFVIFQAPTFCCLESKLLTALDDVRIEIDGLASLPVIRAVYGRGREPGQSSDPAPR